MMIPTSSPLDIRNGLCGGFRVVGVSGVGIVFSRMCSDLVTASTEHCLIQRWLEARTWCECVRWNPHGEGRDVGYRWAVTQTGD